MGLIELVVGLGLIAICIMGLNALVVSMIRGNTSALLNDQATRLAVTKLEDLRSLGYDKVAVGKTLDTWWSASSGAGTRFDRATVVSAGALPELRAVTVTMSWNDHGARTSAFSTEIGK